MKKLIFVVIIISILILVGCTKTTIETTQIENTTETFSTTLEQTTIETTQSETTEISTTSEEIISTEQTITEETSAVTEPVIVLDNTPHDPSSHKIGSYVNLIYDDYYCDVEYTVKKDVGSKESVTISVTMKKGYYFDGIYKNNFDKENILNNGKQDCTIQINQDTTIYINYSVKVVYHNDNKEYIDYYPIAYYKCPVALNANTFSKNGYVLSEYLTEDNEYVSPGSRFFANKPDYNVYCIWEEVNPNSDFICEGSTIIKYVGTNTNVVIPEKINGTTITKIASDAFINDNINRIFIPKTINTIEDGAIVSNSISELVLHDSITRMTVIGIDCPNLESLRINSITGFYFETDSNGDIFATNNKYDRLLWARNFKKIVIYGASGSLYGWDCEEINKEFGNEYVIINLGMNANMCSSLLFEGITPFLNADDILLWACEPGDRVLGNPIFTYFQTWWYTGAYLDLYRNVNISNYSNVFEYFAEYNKYKSRNNASYKTVDLRENIYGDSVRTRPNNYTTMVNYKFDYFTNYDYSHMSNIINKFNDKGVKVLFTYPAYISECTKISELEYYREKILENFNVIIISNTEDCDYSIKYFWNSEWHLTNEGAHLRTLQTIKDLQNYFKNK